MRFRSTWLAASVLFAAPSACTQGPSATPQPQPNTELHKELGVDRLMAIPVPPEDGPKLAPLSMAAPVYAAPRVDSEKIGYLRLGAKVARSEQPVSHEN